MCSLTSSSQVSIIVFLPFETLIFILGFKKVFNVLNCLLNYSAFIQHTYSKTILVAKDQIDERNDLLIEVNRLRKEIEDVKMKDEKNINAIRNLDTKIPRQRSKITQLENLEKTLRKDLVTIQENFERTEMKITEHRSQIEETNRMMVSDQEIERINYAKMEIDKQLDEQDQLTAAGRQQFIENSHAVEKASAITSKMENLFTTSVISTDEIKKKLSMINEMSLEVASSESEVKSLGSEVTNASQILKEKSKSVKQLEKEIAALIASRDSEVGARKKKLKEKQNILRKLTVTEASLAATHQSIKKEQDSLYQIASSVIKHMSSNDYNPKI